MDLFMGKLDILISLSSFDDEYQRKRQEEQNRKPHNFDEGMARDSPMKTRLSDPTPRVYVGHARLSDKAVLLTTDKRILLSNKNSVLGLWSTEWEMLRSTTQSKLTIAPLNANKGFLW
uniref:Uncharacterized protein n=1 Tax=Rhabditophanes sp. KR3021 TaxID=114890 RepID=A0AC35UD47_9BILA